MSNDVGEQRPVNSTQPRESTKFFIAIGFLLLLVALGWFRDESQNNILFLTLLALACSMVFVYLPLATAELNVGWFKAGGAAAVFGVVLWLTIPFAQDLKKSNYESTIAAQNVLISGLKKIQSDLELERNSALAAKTAGDACNAKWATLKKYLDDSASASVQLKSSLDQVQRWAEAARGNSSDAATCSLRASQSINELGQSRSFLDKVSSGLSSAKALVQ
jgi:hypothetical protein